MGEHNVYCGCTSGLGNPGYRAWAKARSLNPTFAGKGFCPWCGYIPWMFLSAEEENDFRESMGLNKQ